MLSAVGVDNALLDIRTRATRAMFDQIHKSMASVRAPYGGQSSTARRRHHRGAVRRLRIAVSYIINKSKPAAIPPF
jgi:hypothetical protein